MAAVSAGRTWRAGLFAAVLVGAAGGCGTQGDAQALPDEWPRAGVVGYRFASPDAPLILNRDGWDLDEPALEPGPGPGPGPSDGPRVLWGRMAPRAAGPAGPDGPRLSVLFRAELPALAAVTEPSAALQDALTPSLPWEGDALRGPSFVSGLGPDEAAPGAPVLVYQGADGSVGLARLSGPGVEKVAAPAPLAAASLLGAGGRVGRVTAVRAGAQLRLYYTVDAWRLLLAEAPLAAVADWAQGGGVAAVPWHVRGPLVSAGAFAVPPGRSDAKPAERIDGAAVRRVPTATGRARYDLFVAATSGTKSALAAASSWDGERFLVLGAPVLPVAGTVLTPTGVLDGERALLLVGLRAVQTSIALAEQP